MKKTRKKKLNSFLLISIILISIIGLFYFGFSQNILGVRAITYDGEFRIDEGQIVNKNLEGTFTLPEDTNLFSVNVFYDLETDYFTSTEGIADIRYDIFNYATNSYEVLHSKTWNVPNPYRGSSYVRADGWKVYIDGIPEHMAQVQDPQYQYARYFGCLPGMTVNEAKQLNPWEESTSSKKSYTYNCLLPGDVVYDRDYDNEPGEVNIDYFPQLKTFDSNYISNGEVKIKIYVNIKKGGFERIRQDDFYINVIEVETPAVDTYSFDGTECVYQAKYSYQVTENDYYTKNECEFQNNLIECYIDSQCLAQSDEFKAFCEEDVCVEEKKTIIDKIFPDKEEPVTDEVKEDSNFSILGIIISLVVLTFIFIIIRNILKRKRK